MPTYTKPPAPFLTRKGLRHIQEEVIAARYELIEMLEMGADIRAIWNKSRKYFEPEEGTLIPFPNEELSRLLKPTWNVSDLADPVRSALLGDIFAHAQFFKFARREIIPEKF